MHSSLFTQTTVACFAPISIHFHEARLDLNYGYSTQLIYSRSLEETITYYPSHMVKLLSLDDTHLLLFEACHMSFKHFQFQTLISD